MTDKLIGNVNVLIQYLVEDEFVVRLWESYKTKQAWKSYKTKLGV